MTIDQSRLRDSKRETKIADTKGEWGTNVTDVGSLAIFKENAPTRKKEEKVIPLMTFDEE
jgi:hypothetical protein